MIQQKCPICDEYKATYETRTVSYQYKGHAFDINQPALWCDACGEGVINSADNKAVAVNIEAQRTWIDALLEPQQITKSTNI